MESNLIKKSCIVIMILTILFLIFLIIFLIIFIVDGRNNSSRVESSLVNSSSFVSSSQTTSSSSSSLIASSSSSLGLCIPSGNPSNIFAFVGPANGLPSGFSGDNGQALQARTNRPQTCIFDSNSCLVYFPDSSNNRIRAVNTQTGIIQTVVGDGQLAFNIGSSATNSSIVSISSLALLPNNVIVFPQPLGLGFVLVRYLPTQTNPPTINLLTPETPTGVSSGTNLSDATFIFISAVAVDSQGNLYVNDQYDIRRIDPQGNVNFFAGNSTNLFPYLVVGDNPLAASIGQPLVIDFDSNDNVYILCDLPEVASRIIYRFNVQGSPFTFIVLEDETRDITSFSINRLTNELWYLQNFALYSIDLLNLLNPPILRCGQPGQNELGNVNVLASSTTLGGTGPIRFDDFGNLYCSIEINSPDTSVIRRINTNI